MVPKIVNNEIAMPKIPSIGNWYVPNNFSIPTIPNEAAGTHSIVAGNAAKITVAIFLYMNI
ncbi:hypothetical protein GCM10011356_12280 [Kangiella profundi]|nr:hypothetical protein GCM10011356_12280 [Kangiella profundi]